MDEGENAVEMRKGSLYTWLKRGCRVRFYGTGGGGREA